MLPGEKKVTLRLEHIKCSKPSCQKCPHGPYWYAYWHEGKRLKKKYLGKQLPEQPWRPEQSDVGQPVPLTEEEKDWLTIGVMVRTSFTATRKVYRCLVVQLNKKIKEATNLVDRGDAMDYRSKVRGAFRRLFPNRR